MRDAHSGSSLWDKSPLFVKVLICLGFGCFILLPPFIVLAEVVIGYFK